MSVGSSLRRVVGSFLVAATLLACGGTVVFEESSAAGGTGGGTPSPQDTGGPLALWIADREGCGIEAPLDEAQATLDVVADDGGESLVVADLAFVEECTDAGGQYILARAIDGSREMWLGAHACTFFDRSRIDGALHAGLVRVSQTATIFSPREGSCVTFPGEVDPLSSDVKVTAVALFANRDDAIAYAAALR